MIVVLVLDIPARMALYGCTYHALAPHMVEEFVFPHPPPPPISMRPMAGMRMAVWQCVYVWCMRERMGVREHST